ncbi:T-cell surface antigen CD2 [Stegastes partitus]|uniref:T-cell surface antigen CD2-like n=1 Tax=Stegastes partitus TaxID=144197 RepID=A0A3B4ZYH6_9TELE|nr:PREDICTED: T-cell surface antigen CD2-like [Stegastes partitus]
MEMASVSAVGLLLLCCSVLADSEDACDQYAAAGKDVTIPMKYKLSEKFKWKFNSEVIFYKAKDSIIGTTNYSVDPDGSLKLAAVTKDNEGIYKPEVFGADGKALLNVEGIRLCVVERVRKPSVIQKCSEKTVVFTCTAAKGDAHVKFEWLRDNKVEAKTPTLTLNTPKVENQAFICNVSNEVSSAVSDPITQNCYKSGLLPDSLFGINIWIIVGVGAGLVVLLIVLVIVCCIRARRTKRMRLRDEEELRLEFTNPDQQQQCHHHTDRHQRPHQHQHQHQHRHQHQQQPAGHTGPRQHRTKQNRSQPPQTRAGEPPNGVPQPSPRRPAQAPRPPSDEQPPPLPQPRKKTPRKV